MDLIWKLLATALYLGQDWMLLVVEKWKNSEFVQNVTTGVKFSSKELKINKNAQYQLCSPVSWDDREPWNINWKKFFHPHEYLSIYSPVMCPRVKATAVSWEPSLPKSERDEHKRDRPTLEQEFISRNTLDWTEQMMLKCKTPAFRLTLTTHSRNIEHTLMSIHDLNVMNQLSNSGKSFTELSEAWCRKHKTQIIEWYTTRLHICI